MADADVVKGEEARLRDARHQKLARSIASEWYGSGYQPRAHLEHVSGDGDGTVLHDFWRDERRRHESTRGGNFSSLLVILDISDVANAIKAGRA